MLKTTPRFSRPDSKVEAASYKPNACFSRKLTYQECIERGWDPAKYDLTPDSVPDEPKLVDDALNKQVKKGKHNILPNRPPRNVRK